MTTFLKAKCPVCQHEIDPITDTINGAIAEEYLECHNCRMYIYAYAYGGTSIYVNGMWFDWHYSECPPVDLINKAISRSIEYLLDITET